MEPFAGVADYERRYGAAADPGRVTALLEDATALMLSEYAGRYGTEYEKGAHLAFDLNACAVCCSLAHRAVGSDDGLQGVSQVSDTAGPWAKSLTFSNPYGDLYMTKSERRALGLASCRVKSVPASTEGGAYG